MEVKVGKNAGFCYGVRRAVEGAENIILDNKKVYCLGEIVHNKQVVDKLKKDGVQFIDNIEEIIRDKANNEKKKMIIRAHGVAKDVYLKARENQIEIIDYTCPNVLRIHEIAEEYSKQGYYIFVIGMENHPETIGTKSYCGLNYFVISDENMIEKGLKEFELSGINKLLMISQTTFSMNKFKKIKEETERQLKGKEVDFIIKNTICLATEQRQKETEMLSKKVDCMIIIGGRKSSNTKKLFEIADSNCEHALLIETKEEIKSYDFKEIEKIGIMAGASTPQNSIDDVVEFCDEKKTKVN